MSELQFTVPAEQSGKRIDSWLAEQIEGLTRSAAQNLLSEQAVSCNGQSLKKNYKLVGGEAITVQLPELKEVDLKPENIPLDIVMRMRILWWSTSHAAWLCIRRPATGTARW